MGSLLITFLVTFAASVALTPLIRSVAWRFGAVDRPDGVRKLHGRPVPLWGGVAVYLAVSLGLLVAHWGSFATGPILNRLTVLFLPSAGLVCLIGAVDDRRHLTSRWKLALQILAVLPIVLVGFWVPQIWICGMPINFGWLGVPLTICWLLGCINALNLLDGMDGLASMVGLSTAAMMGLIAVNEGHPEVAVVGTVLAAALGGFLVYNLPPATIFLGDSGSMLIGLAVGLLGFQGNLKTPATLSITAPAVAMALPMLDVVLAVIRRRLTGRRFDAADRQHIHHRLLDRGLTPWQVLCILGAACLLTGTIAATATYLRSDALAWIAMLTLVVLAVRIRLLGHHEFLLIRHAIVRGLARLFPRLRAFALESELEGMEFDDLWHLLLAELRPWQAHSVQLTVSAPNDDGVLRQDWSDAARNVKPQPASKWSVAVRFQRRDERRCELRAELAHEGRRNLAPLAHILQVFAVHFVACSAPAVYQPLVEPHTPWPIETRKEAA